jgi:hypothetical protein
MPGPTAKSTKPLRVWQASQSLRSLLLPARFSSVVAYRLPLGQRAVLFSNREYAEVGGLMSYGSNASERNRLASTHWGFWPGLAPAYRLARMPQRAAMIHLP